MNVSASVRSGALVDVVREGRAGVRAEARAPAPVPGGGGLTPAEG